jgi:serine protease inhibitor
MMKIDIRRRILLQAALALVAMDARKAFAEDAPADKPADASAEKPADVPVDKPAELSPPDHAPIDAKRLLSAQLLLGRNLIDQLGHAKQKRPNIIVSPASLTCILAFLDTGASPQMRKAIHHTLGFPENGTDAPDGDLEGVLSAAATILHQTGENGPLVLANMIVFDPVSQPYQAALDKLHNAGADVSVEDLKKPETIEHINSWVKGRTKGLIPTILDEAPRDPGLVAVNALYFKDRWKVPFDPADTKVAKFHSLGGKSIDLPMMHLAEGEYAFRQNGSFIAVDLSYASEGYRLVVITSKQAPVGMHEFAAVTDWLGGEGFMLQHGEVALPRFSASGQEELLAALDALGLAKARTSGDSLKGFTAVSQTISRVVQRTELRVNEEGTEAAAATAVTTMRSVSPDGYVKMVVDKPFVFALRDRKSGLVLLEGYVAQPSELADSSAK